MKAITLILIFFLASCSPDTRPNEILFAGIQYKIEDTEKVIKLISKKDTLSFTKLPNDLRHISPCPRPAYFMFDCDEDGKKDFCFYDCGFMNLYIDRGHPLSKTLSIDLKFKEEHWIDKTQNRKVNIDELKGLKKLNALIHDIDPDI